VSGHCSSAKRLLKCDVYMVYFNQRPLRLDVATISTLILPRVHGEEHVTNRIFCHHAIYYLAMVELVVLGCSR
jgi:hypothetical protein